MYLIFLTQHNGQWMPLAMSYYVFEEVWADGTAYWRPVANVSSFHLSRRPDGIRPERIGIYRQDKLESALAGYLGPNNTPWPGEALLVPDQIQAQLAADRNLPAGCQFNWVGGLVRWEDTNINLQHNTDNAPGDIFTRLSNATTALLSAYEGLGLNYVGAASPPYTPDCSGFPPPQGNDVNTYLNGLPGGEQNIIVIFDDPCDRITDLIGCSGVYALSGFSSPPIVTHQYKGLNWLKARWGYVVLNNNLYTDCLNASEYELLLQHELTQVHCMKDLDANLYPNQNMNPPGCCNPISWKDEECMDYVYDAAPPLPVELIRFEAFVRDEQVELEWATANEFQNKQYIIERSRDGVAFTAIGTLAPGMAAQSNTYAFVDAYPLPGTSYYRLVQEDLSGSKNLLGIRSVVFEAHAHFAVYPNPGGLNELNIVSQADNGRLQVIDATGRLVLQRQLTTDDFDGGAVVLSIADVPKGIYTINWIGEKQQWSTLFVRK